MNRYEYLAAAKESVGKVVDHVMTYPKAYAVAGVLLLVFLIGFYARGALAAVTCIGEIPGTMTCTVGATTPPTPAPTPIPIPTPSPPSEYAACPAGTQIIKNKWGQTAIETVGFGTQIVVVEVKVPATGFSGTKTSSWGEYGGAPTTREATLSTKPCDFSDSGVLKNGYGQLAHKRDVVSFNFAYRVGTASGFSYGLTAGQTYYISIRNKDGHGVDTCATGVPCDMRGGLPQ
jgi:hypothetical protein